MTSGVHQAFVLDASVALAAFFEDEQDDYSVEVWRSMSGTQVCVPALWHLELANILSRALRGGRITTAALDEAWGRLERVQMRVVPVAPDVSLWTRLAGEWGLSSYDAVYLDTALRQRLPLATKDRVLGEAARRVGVPLYLNPSILS